MEEEWHKLQANLLLDFDLNWFMLSIHCVTHLAVFRFEIVCLEKSLILQCTKLTLADRLTRSLRLISLAHRATKLLFSLAQDQHLFAQGSGTWVFSCPVCYQSFLSFNWVISKCSQFFITHEKDWSIMLQVKIFTWICDTALFVADYQRFRVKWTNNVN